MLLSYINTQLRDNYRDLDDLATDWMSAKLKFRKSWAKSVTTIKKNYISLNKLQNIRQRGVKSLWRIFLCTKKDCRQTLFFCLTAVPLLLYFTARLSLPLLPWPL